MMRLLLTVLIFGGVAGGIPHVLLRKMGWSRSKRLCVRHGLPGQSEPPRRAIPAVNGERSMVDASGLMSYGADTAEDWRLVGTYVGRMSKALAGASVKLLAYLEQKTWAPGTVQDGPHFRRSNQIDSLSP